METEKQKNVFAELQKNRKPRGKGLATSPKLGNEVNNIRLPEKSEAINSIGQTPRRTYRVSTFISEQSGDTLDELILSIKHSEGKKPKIARVIEMALDSLKSNYNQ